MTRQRVVLDLRKLAQSLGPKAYETEWHLFGSVERDVANPKDIDLMILCNSASQADALRRAIDPDALFLPIHLSLLTFDEAREIDAVRVQQSRVIYP